MLIFVAKKEILLTFFNISFIFLQVMLKIVKNDNCVVFNVIFATSF